MSDTSDESRDDAQHTMVIEAALRHEWEDREAYGTIDDMEVYVVARLRDGKYLELVSMVGGEWYHYEDDMEDEYVRHTKTKRTFESVDDLRVAFRALVEEHDLERQLPEDWKDENEVAA